MSAMRKPVLSLAAVIALGALAAGCGSVSDIGESVPFKQSLLGKPAPSPDLPDRPKLVMPPPNVPLPVPGQAAPAQTQWAASAQQPNSQTAAAAPAQDNSSGWFSGLFGSGEAKKTQ